MSSEKDFIEFLIFMNKFVFLWELLKYSPDSWESYSIVEDEKTLCCSLVDKDGNEITILDILKSPKPDFIDEINKKDNIKLQMIF